MAKMGNGSLWDNHQEAVSGNPTSYQLLIVEDDRQLNHALKIYFEKEGYRVKQAYSVFEAERNLEINACNLVIADIGLPDCSGLELARVYRKRNIPIIFLTAKDEEQDILDGYDAGCEEYITKPVSPKILQKKIEAILRRRVETENILKYKDIRIHFEQARVWKRDTEIKLTAKEWKVLKLLAENKGRILTKEILLGKIWDIDADFVDEHVVKVVINRLRKKIEDTPGENVYIKNIFGVGYTFGE